MCLLREADSADGLIMTSAHCETLEGVGIPDPHCVVLASAGDQGGVVTHIHAQHDARVATQRLAGEAWQVEDSHLLAIGCDKDFL